MNKKCVALSVSLLVMPVVLLAGEMDPDTVQISGQCQGEGKSAVCSFSAYGHEVNFSSGVDNAELSLFMNPVTETNNQCAPTDSSFSTIDDTEALNQFLNQNKDWCVGVMAKVDGQVVASFAHWGSSFKMNQLHQTSMMLKKTGDGYQFSAP